LPLVGGSKTNAEWKRRLVTMYSNGKPITYGYGKSNHDGTYENMGINKYEELKRKNSPEIRGFKAHHRKAIRINDTDIVVSQANNFSVILTKLQWNFESRYLTAMKGMVELVNLGVFKYTGKADTDRGIKEALRHVFKRFFRVYKYEYNIVFKGELGYEIFKELKTYERGKKGGDNYPDYETTAYLKGWNEEKKEVKVKSYNISARDRIDNEHRKADAYKIEITLLPEYFTKIGINVNEMLTLEYIQSKIKERLKQEFKFIWNRFSPEVKGMIKSAMGVKNLDGYLNFTVEVKNTFQHMNDRITKIENEIKDLKAETAETKKRMNEFERIYKNK
jgi:hypothetical protein